MTTFDEWRELFGKQGPQVGDAMPSARLVDQSGDEVALESLWEGRPAVLVSASLTCPVARSRIPELTKLIADRGEAVGRGILYTKEAHPKIDKAPHADGEWLTTANERDGILHRQPRELEARLELARTMRDGWTPGYLYFVDAMDDALYEAFGTAPCTAVLVDAEGVVRVRQGWLEPVELAAALSELLGD